MRLPALIALLMAACTARAIGLPSPTDLAVPLDLAVPADLATPPDMALATSDLALL